MAHFDRERDAGAHPTGSIRRRGAPEPARATAAPVPCGRRHADKRLARLRDARVPLRRLRAARLPWPGPSAAQEPGRRAQTDPGRPRGRSRLVLLLHSLFFLAAAAQSAIVPLLPRLSHAYGLSPSAGALLLAAPGLTTLAVSMPAGMLADRLGARRVTVAAAFLMAVATLAQAAPSYLILIGGRLAFGMAFGIVWTTGVAWMSSSHGESGSPRLGAVATSAAVGMAVGPAIGGIVADRFGLSTPFLLVGGLAAMLSLLLSREPADARRARAVAGTSSLRVFASLAPRRPGVLVGAGVLAIGGAVGGVIQLLIPLELHGAGFTTSGTGAAFSAAAGAYIVVSALVVRRGRSAITPRRAAIAGLVLALSLLPAAFGIGGLALVGVLLLSTATRAVVSTVAYPLATESAAGAELPEGVVIGLLNGAWAAGLVLAPLLAGAIDQEAGPAAAYLTAVVPGSVGAVWLLARANALPALTGRDPAAPAATSEPPTAEHELAVAT